MHGLPTYWVPADPVPPLPTEPYTVIRATFRDGTTAAIVLDSVNDWGEARWYSISDERPWTDGELDGITGFEVLAEPRDRWLEEIQRAEQETARAVLNRVRESALIKIVTMANPRNGDAFDAIAREFGVDQ